MKTILSGTLMKELDRHTIEDIGIPSCVLMERAAFSAAEEIRRRFSPKKKILAVCGTGNNGGDGVAAARILYGMGYDAGVLLLGDPEHRTEETARQIMIAEKMGVPFAAEADFCAYDVIIDAIFGIGLTRGIEGNYAEVIGKINDSPAFVVSIDIPSGIHADTGQILGTAVCADLTVCIAFLKAGECLYPGRLYCGETRVCDIGVYDPEEKAAWHTMEEEDLLFLTKREAWGNKTTFGKIGVAGGSPGMCGAAVLSALGAFKAGAGMLSLLVAEENRQAVNCLLPEAMTRTGESEEELEAFVDWCDGFVIGPGLGRGERGERLMKILLPMLHASGKPFVLDADAISLLAAHPEWKQYLSEKTVLTPHPGEMSRLCGLPVSSIQEDPVGNAARQASSWGCIIVQKDACTVTAGPDGSVWLNRSGNDGMATAGSGDVLSGICAALLYRNADPGETAAAAAGAVLLHGLGGDLAAEKYGRHGMTARNISEGAAEKLKELWNSTEE